MKSIPVTPKPSSKRSKFDFFCLQLGTNSIVLTLGFIILVIVSYRADILNWDYLKGLGQGLAFFISFFSIIFGFAFYSFWRLDKESIYTLHLVRTKLLTNDINIIFIWKDLAFGISHQKKIKSVELPSSVRLVFSIGLFYSLMLLTLDNSGFNELQKFPSKLAASSSEFCPDKTDTIADTPPLKGCELIIRAHKLGYAKDLGVCAPKKLDPEKMEVCENRRDDEPYLHYMYRLLHDFSERLSGLIENNKVKQVTEKFELQLQQLKALKDYQTYAMSAAPRSSHHIWTNLPHPENIVIQKYREFLNPNYCIKKFQNQKNTIMLEEDDERKNSKLLEHVYGQLLFNPKNEITVGFCKEYKIHWSAAPEICDRLVERPSAVLQEAGILGEVELVLRRHDIANSILDLDEQMQKIEKASKRSSIAKTKIELLPNQKTSNNHLPKNIIKGKIAKARQQLRKKSEIVSFQCFMQTSDFEKNNSKIRRKENMAKFQGIDLMVKTRYFSRIKDKGEAQIAMYHEFAKALDRRFHYSQLTSRSEIDIESRNGDALNNDVLLEQPSYLLSRLEILKNVDIFLGYNWVLERDDLLKVYPYHVHLKNYAKRFRSTYQENRGRL